MPGIVISRAEGTEGKGGGGGGEGTGVDQHVDLFAGQIGGRHSVNSQSVIDPRSSYSTMSEQEKKENPPVEVDEAAEEDDEPDEW